MLTELSASVPILPLHIFIEYVLSWLRTFKGICWCCTQNILALCVALDKPLASLGVSLVGSLI